MEPSTPNPSADSAATDQSASTVAGRAISVRRRGVGTHLKEWLWRGEALRRADLASDSERMHTADLLALSAQRGDAAESLWNTGHAAEAIRLAIDAFGVAEELTSDHTSLRSFGATDEQIAAIERARTSILGSEPPLLDDEALEIATGFYIDVRDGRRVLAHLHRGIGLGRSGILRERWTRVSFVLAGVLSVLCLAVFLMTRPSPPKVFASASYPGRDHIPENACDGDPDSEWLLPDASNGWIECEVMPSADIRRVRLINGRNQSYGDRGVKDYTVKLLRGSDVVAEHEGSFDRIESHPRPVSVSISGEGITAVRVDVRSYHRRGAAIKEIEWR